MRPLFTMPSGGMRGLNLALVLTTVGLILAGVGSTAAWPSEAGPIWLTVVSGLATVAFIWVILPQRYEIWPDRLRIVFLRWRWDLSFDTIDSAQPGKGWEAYAYAGVRFATSPGQSIVVRRRGSNLFTRPQVVISPADRAVFMRELDKAMGASASRA